MANIDASFMNVPTTGDNPNPAMIKTDNSVKYRTRSSDVMIWVRTTGVSK